MSKNKISAALLISYIISIFFIVGCSSTSKTVVASKTSEHNKIPRPIPPKKQDNIINADNAQSSNQEGTPELKEERKKYNVSTNNNEIMENHSEESKTDHTFKVKKNSMTEEKLSANDWFKKGLELSKTQKYKEEIEAYKQAIMIQPDHIDAHFNLGLSYLIIGDKDSAYKEYEELKRIDPHKAEILYSKAIRRSSANKYNNDFIRQALRKDIDNSSKFINKPDIKDQLAPTKIYTVQTGTFVILKRAQKQYLSIQKKLNSNLLDYLRIEHLGKYYPVRLGNFKDFKSAKNFLNKIKDQISEAIIVEAVFTNEKIVRFYNSHSTVN